MNMKQHCAAAVTAIALVMASTPGAWALVDNSQPPTAVLCSGACGVGSSVGFSRTVPQVSPDDVTTFTDVWNMTLSEAGTIKGVLFGNNTLDAFTVTNLNVRLEDGGIPVDPAAGFTVPNPPPFNTVLQTAVTFANLSAGDYQFMVTGFVPNDQEGGQYQFQGKISEVPLPAAGWLFLTALLSLLGWSRSGRLNARIADKALAVRSNTRRFGVVRRHEAPMNWLSGTQYKKPIRFVGRAENFYSAPEAI